MWKFDQRFVFDNLASKNTKVSNQYNIQGLHYANQQFGNTIIIWISVIYPTVLMLRLAMFFFEFCVSQGKTIIAYERPNEG